ncbi:peptidoglycan-binding domain-containing protein [Amycolatopsis magusensis]|uniref:peptidoglycan-binding domain-containing protein n=1 Tax=Amycolatopsis magusensis TaxID=882444 RepID=UPI003C2BBC41
MLKRIGVLTAVLVLLCGGLAHAVPAVNMEAVLKAAQTDPRRADSAVTPGSGESVLEVERALSDEGLLGAEYVDGHFGTKTVEAYAAYQRSLGLSGLDASGLPGRNSLLKLGEQRFSVTRTLVPGAKVTYRGALMNTRTQAMLAEAEKRLGHALVVTQGSYNPGGDPTSAGTHDGGGVLDLSIGGVRPVKVVRELRTVGFAAWYRSPAQGDWEAHIHAVALADPDLSPPAQHQGGDYYLGRNGLANHGPDDGPEVSPKRTWEEYRRAG